MNEASSCARRVRGLHSSWTKRSKASRAARRLSLRTRGQATVGLVLTSSSSRRCSADRASRPPTRWKSSQASSPRNTGSRAKALIAEYGLASTAEVSLTGNICTIDSPAREAQPAKRGRNP